MNLNNEDSLFYKISDVIISVVIIILICIHVFNQYNGQNDEFLFACMLICTGIKGLLESILQVKFKKNKINFVIFLSLGVFSILVGFYFMI